MQSDDKSGVLSRREIFLSRPLIVQKFIVCRHAYVCRHFITIWFTVGYGGVTTKRQLKKFFEKIVS